jgi:hypothetical protein
VLTAYKICLPIAIVKWRYFFPFLLWWTFIVGCCNWYLCSGSWLLPFTPPSLCNLCTLCQPASLASTAGMQIIQWEWCQNTPVPLRLTYILHWSGVILYPPCPEHLCSFCTDLGVPVTVCLLEAGGFLLPGFLSPGFLLSHPFLVHCSCPCLQVHLQYKLYTETVVKQQNCIRFAYLLQLWGGGAGTCLPSCSGKHVFFFFRGPRVPFASDTSVLEAVWFLLRHPISVHMVNLPFSQVHL